MNVRSMNPNPVQLEASGCACAIGRTRERVDGQIERKDVCARVCEMECHSLSHGLLQYKPQGGREGEQSTPTRHLAPRVKLRTKQGVDMAESKVMQARVICLAAKQPPKKCAARVLEDQEPDTRGDKRRPSQHQSGPMDQSIDDIDAIRTTIRHGTISLNFSPSQFPDQTLAKRSNMNDMIA